MTWKYSVKITHLMDNVTNISYTMKNIGTILRKQKCFRSFKSLPGFFKVDNKYEADQLLEEMYDYADAHQIWIE